MDLEDGWAGAFSRCSTMGSRVGQTFGRWLFDYAQIPSGR